MPTRTPRARGALAWGVVAAAFVVACHAARSNVPPPVAAKAAATPVAHRASANEDDAGPTDAGAETAVDPRFATLDAPIDEALREGKLPGCVVVVGRHDEILFQKAYGLRAIVPEPEPMTLDTIFDLASLTKAIATTTSVMLLADEGRIDLDAPASRWLPELGDRGRFSPRQLLVHTSGLPAVTALAGYTPDRQRLLASVASLHRDVAPGTRFVYSDVGFVLLEEIVRRASGEDFAAFTRKRIFEPLGMKDARFLPPEELRTRIAPTEMRDGGIMRGEVHDPRAFALGGVAGHAGLFATADDVARFAQAMLGRGARAGTRLVSEKTFDRFLTRHETSKGPRALGWDIESAYAIHKSPRMSRTAFGHGGFTGTALWVDPERDLFFLFLSNRVHPDGHGSVNPLVKELATRAVDAVDVDAGIDVLSKDGWASLAGAKIGLLTNDAAQTKSGERTLDVLRRAAGVDLRVVFTPEHGLAADREGRIADARLGEIPVRSLYGAHDAPTEQDLAGIDTLVVDLEDVGVRFYTYASTLKRTMRAIAYAGGHVRVVVLDRPDPLGGTRVEGPVLEAVAPDGGLGLSFVNHHPLPVVHGMTLGELARLFVDDEQLTLPLEVVRVRNWRRSDTLDRTGLPWTSPSPNLRSLRAAILYPAVGLLEGTNVSVGRGTDTPFEVLGAPYLDEDAFVKALEGEHLAGVRVERITFRPDASVHAGKTCHGARFVVEDRDAFSPVRTALGIARALRATAGAAWRPEGFHRMLGHTAAVRAFEAGEPIAQIEATWQDGLRTFEARRARALLYP